MKKTATYLTLSALCMAGANAALLAYYDYNGDANDRSGNGANGTLTNGALISADGTGYSGAAGDSALNLGTNAGTDSEHSASTVDFSSAIANNSMAVSFWQFHTGNGAGGNVSSTPFAVVGTGAAARGFGAHTPWSNGILYFDHSGCCSAPGQRLTSPASLGTGLLDSWHHIVLQVDNGSKEIWVDGTMINSQATGAAAITDTLTGSLLVGLQFDGSVGFPGLIDEFAVWDAALSPSQIQSLAGGASTLSLIPEPSSGILVLFGGLLAIRRRRR